MRAKVSALSLVAVCLVAGRGIAAEEAGFTQLVVQKTGGIAGVQLQYDIKSDGTYKITNRQGKRTEGKLAAAQLKALSAAVAGVPWAELPRRQVKTGPDQFIYTVAILADGKYYNRTFSDTVHAENKAMQAFLTELSKIE